MKMKGNALCKAPLVDMNSGSSLAILRAIGCASKTHIDLAVNRNDGS